MSTATKPAKKFKTNMGIMGNEASGNKKKFHQEKRNEIADDEIEDDDHDDLLDSAIEATQRYEFLQSVSAIFVDAAIPK